MKLVHQKQLVHSIELSSLASSYSTHKIPCCMTNLQCDSSTGQRPHCPHMVLHAWRLIAAFTHVVSVFAFSGLTEMVTRGGLDWTV